MENSENIQLKDRLMIGAILGFVNGILHFLWVVQISDYYFLDLFAFIINGLFAIVFFDLFVIAVYLLRTRLGMPREMLWYVIISLVWTVANLLLPVVFGSNDPTYSFIWFDWRMIERGVFYWLVYYFLEGRLDPA